MTAGGLNPTLVIQALAARNADIRVILEQPETKIGITRRRARRLGWVPAIGQLGTMIAARILRNFANKRIAQILGANDLTDAMPANVRVHQVGSINDEGTLALVEQIRPAAILLVSTRLLSARQLAAMPCPVLNLHAGINPAYRGQMGGYWSLREGDAGNFGATVHLVDAGTDTGGTLYEVRAAPAHGDFISTYPLVLTVAALDITCRAVEDALSRNLRPYAPQGPSALRFPPTLWSWIFHGITRRIW
ncbi:formyl transferase [Rhizobium sp. SL42]|nr:formyl transferase [Rhizobium sp. SL42]